MPTVIPRRYCASKLKIRAIPNIESRAKKISLKENLDFNNRGSSVAVKKPPVERQTTPIEILREFIEP